MLAQGRQGGRGMVISWQFAVVLAASSVASALIALLALSLLPRRRNAPALPVEEGEAVFVFDDTDLVAASPAARALLDGLPGTGDWQRLSTWLCGHFPEVAETFSAPEREGALTLTSAGGMQLSIDGHGGLTRIGVVLPAADAPLVVERLSLRAQEEELADLRRVVEHAPVLVWRQAPDGSVIWANAAYLEAAGEDDLVWPLPRLFDPFGPSDAPRRIRSIGGSPGWYDCHAVAEPSGLLGFAVPADALVHAESTRREFVQTLGKTFAELPVGLAIFDQRRHLQLFNPALCDLTLLDFEFLSARPSLFAFLDRLREKRMMPEPRDYAGWRQRMAELETAAVSGRYEETWSLPTGQTYRVTGRPHPEGAVAFLFEDISAEVSLTRRFRAELELGQSVLDSLDEAIAVFSPGGTLVVSNAAYARLWRVESGAALCEVTLAQSARHWQDGGLPPGVATRLRDLAAAPLRQQWEGEAELPGGGRLVMRLKPLGKAGVLSGFRLAAPRPGDAPSALPAVRQEEAMPVG